MFAYNQSLDAAFNADMVADYLIEKAEEEFALTKFFGIYRDDGEIVFEGEQSTAELEQWLYWFQERINQIVGGKEIQFTMDIWKPGTETREITPKLNVIGLLSFPYFDTEMSYNKQDTLERIYADVDVGLTPGPI